MCVCVCVCVCVYTNVGTLGMLKHAWQRPWPTSACLLCPRRPTSKRNPPTFYLISFEAKE